jgi:hypothetical protein
MQRIKYPPIRNKIDTAEPAQVRAWTRRLRIPAFSFPHVMGKFAAGEVSAATAGFSAKAGFHPPELWIYSAA